MKIAQMIWDKNSQWQYVYGDQKIQPNLIICFGSRDVISDDTHYTHLKKTYPNCNIVMSSSGGEILNDEVHDNTIVATLLEFEKTQIKCAFSDIKVSDDSFAVGKKLAQELNTPELSGIFLLTDGLIVNGSKMVEGMCSIVDSRVIITGGMASDGGRFQQTLVGLNSAPQTNKVAAIGFYGDDVKIGHGSMGGWVPFGPEREVTKSDGNVLYELCGHPALALYKKYLGDSADNLPGDALLYPLSIRSSLDSNDAVVRTILSVNEEDQSLTFAGDIQQGGIAQLMYGNFDNLVDGAEKAAEQASIQVNQGEQVAILISCIGRRMLMGQQINDELEVIYNFWGKKIPLTGFYSYGEISPHSETGHCGLHNQTMTITTIGESS